MLSLNGEGEERGVETRGRGEWRRGGEGSGDEGEGEWRRGGEESGDEGERGVERRGRGM